MIYRSVFLNFSSECIGLCFAAAAGASERRAAVAARDAEARAVHAASESLSSLQAEISNGALSYGDLSMVNLILSHGSGLCLLQVSMPSLQSSRPP